MPVGYELNDQTLRSPWSAYVWAKWLESSAQSWQTTNTSVAPNDKRTASGHVGVYRSHRASSRKCTPHRARLSFAEFFAASLKTHRLNWAWHCIAHNIDWTLYVLCTPSSALKCQKNSLKIFREHFQSKNTDFGFPRFPSFLISNSALRVHLM